LADAEVFDKTRETDRVFFELQVMQNRFLTHALTHPLARTLARHPM